MKIKSNFCSPPPPAFVFVFLLTILISMGLLSAMLFPLMLKYNELEKRSSESEMEEIRQGLLEYFRDTGSLPATTVTITGVGTRSGIAALVVLPSSGGGFINASDWRGPYISKSLINTLNDVWGSRYLYTKDPAVGVVPNPYTNYGFVLASCGPNKVLNTSPSTSCSSTATSVLSSWPDFKLVNSQDDLIVRGNTQSVREEFRKETLSRLGRSPKDSEESLRTVFPLSLDNQLVRKGLNPLKLNESNPGLYTVTDIVQSVDPTIELSNFFTKDSLNQPIRWERGVGSPAYEGRYYSTGLNRIDNHGQEDITDYVKDDPFYAPPVGEGLLDVTLVFSHGTPNNDLRNGCPEGYDSRGFWKTYKYGGRERVYDYSRVGTDSSVITSQITYGRNDGSPTLSNYILNPYDRPWVTLCTKRGPGYLFVQRVYLVEGQLNNDGLQKEEQCEDPSEYRGEWHPIDGFSAVGLPANNWVNGPNLHPTGELPGDWLPLPYIPSSGASRIKLCVELGSDPELIKDVMLQNNWGNALIPEFPSSLTGLDSFAGVLLDYLNHFPPDLKTSCPGLPNATTAYPIAMLPAAVLGGIQAPVINDLYARFISPLGFSFVGSWASVGQFTPDVNVVIEWLANILEASEQAMVIYANILDAIAGFFGIDLPGWLTHGFLDTLRIVSNTIQSFLQSLYFCTDLNITMFQGLTIPSFYFADFGFPGLDLSFTIGFSCDKVYDSTWQADPALGSAGESSSGMGTSMMSLCNQYYQAGGGWQQQPITPEVSHYGNDVKLQKLAVVPENALWARFFYEDKRLGAVLDSLLPFSPVTFPMNALNVIALVKKQSVDASGSQFEAKVLAKDFGNGRCDEYGVPFLHLQCNDDGLQGYSKVVFVGNISKPDPTLTASENLQKRTLYGLSTPPSAEVSALLGSQKPGYRISRMEYIMPP